MSDQKETTATKDDLEDSEYTFQYTLLGPSTSEENLSRKRSDAENSYGLNPTVEVKRHKMAAIMKKSLEEALKHIEEYESENMKDVTSEISRHIRKELKMLRYPRYRYVCLVTIGEQKDQGVELMSRYLWSPEHDHFAYVRYSNRHVFASAIAYAIYKH